MSPGGRSSFEIASWNVNGLRACGRRGAAAPAPDRRDGFLPWLATTRADVVALQEVRARPEQLEPGLRSPPGWWTAFAPADRLGYSGVALLARRAPDAVEVGLGIPAFDVEGRFLAARWGRLWVASIYFPNGSGQARDNSRVPYKLAFYAAAFEWLQRKRRGGARVVAAGDYNTAHTELDLARPRENRGTSGFLPEERAELDRWLRAGWRDGFRLRHAGPGHYTWWAQRGGARARNVGWRIDYTLLSPNLEAHLLDASIEHQVLGSDHAPIRVALAPDALG